MRMRFCNSSSCKTTQQVFFYDVLKGETFIQKKKKKKKFPKKNNNKTLFVVWAQPKHWYFGKGIKIIKRIIMSVLLWHGIEHSVVLSHEKPIKSILLM